jgi:hypothetical protein
LRRRIADLLRRRKARGEVVSLDDAEHRAEGESLGATLEGVDPWENDWEANVLRAARERVWKRLSPRECQIYEYFESRERDVTATARDMDITAARVYVARYRVERELKKEVERLRQEYF